ncbi:MAG: aldehyde dehydrogenase family protein [Betaproteobacteria bacterium]|nr:aldehyde dehydrogenase family protein [Betaproteobacteria bacterium]
MSNTKPDIILPKGMLIGNAIVTTRDCIGVIDPASGKHFADAPNASQADLDAAVAAAKAAFPAWSARTWADRAEVLTRYIEAIRADIDNLAALLVCEQGKPFQKARSEVTSGLNFFSAYRGMELPVEVIGDAGTQRVEVRRIPLGVVGAITAWNYPVLLALWKIGPALITGNTLVLKPSPYTPLSVLRLGELAKDILPPGVLNVVSGGDELGRWMTDHPDISKIAFTGSTGTGKKIMASAATTLKRITLELGGNDAGIILPDFDVSAQVEDLFWTSFSNCGQVCASIKRLLVHESRMDQVCDGLVDVAKKVKIGAGFDSGVEIGPMQNRMQYDKVKKLIETAGDVGRIIHSGTIPNRDGYFLPLTIVRDVDPDSELWREEQFGPILPIRSYRDIDTAIAEANDSNYGLGASVWGVDLAAAEAVARRLHAGSVWTNTHPAMRPDIPFGGIKQSGYGVEFARYGLAEYTNVQVINVKRSG